MKKEIITRHNILTFKTINQKRKTLQTSKMGVRARHRVLYLSRNKNEVAIKDIK